MGEREGPKVVRVDFGGDGATAERSGGRAHFVETLYRENWRDLCRRLRRVYGEGPPEPEELAQAAFAKIAEIDDFERIRHPRAFLFRTAVNLGLNAIKRMKHARGHVERELQAAGKPLVEENTAEDVYLAKARLDVAARAMAGLTPKQREIVVRSRIYGETYAEIGAATGWSQADISRQLATALAVMQDAVRRSDEES